MDLSILLFHTLSTKVLWFSVDNLKKYTSEIVLEFRTLDLFKLSETKNQVEVKASCGSFPQY